MHIPDGFIGAGTSLGAGAIAVGGVAVSLRRAGEVLHERQIALAGLTSAFVFAAQMINFPVAGGTSGHLMGGVLAAVLVGPWLGAVCISVVLVVQALLFADGGITALGLNVVNIALVGCLGGYALFAGLRAVLPAGRSGLLASAGVAAAASVVAASLAFTLEYALGGQGDVAMGTVVTSMVAGHALIGLGEAAITVLTLGAVLSSRPDLVSGATHLDAAASQEVMA